MTGERIDLVEAAADPDNALPCSGKSCGWHLKTREGAKAASLKDYLMLITVIDKDQDFRATYYRDDVLPQNVYILNETSGTYCELIKKNCRDGFLPAHKDKQS